VGVLLQDLLRSTTLDEPALRARARALGLRTEGVLTWSSAGPPPIHMNLDQPRVRLSLHLAVIALEQNR
jgi:hypothetical protein